MKKISSKIKVSIAIFLLVIITILYFYKNLTSEQITSNSSQSKIEDNYQHTHDYLEANGCNWDYGMSNNAYTVCTENALKKIKAEKQQSYNRFQESMKNMAKNALGLDEELNNEFQDWYKNSDDYNLSRCLANVYYSGAGSAYKQNVTTCQIFEIQRDIELLDKLYENREYFKS